MKSFRMQLGITIALLVLAIALACSGCAGWDGTLMRWAPTEAQKQSADLVVQDLQTLRGHVTPVAEAVRAEAERASRITQAYVGLPETPLEPVPLVVDPPKDPVKEEVLVDAEKAATKPPPTVTDMAATGFSLLEMALGAVGLGGAAVGVRKVIKLQKKQKQTKEWLDTADKAKYEQYHRADDNENKALAQRSAVDELVQNVKDIKKVAGKVSQEDMILALENILDSQTTETRRIVAKARLNAGRKQGDV